MWSVRRLSLRHISKAKRHFSLVSKEQRRTPDLPEKGRWCRFSAREKDRHDRPCGCAERLHRAVRRVSPLCAAFCPDSECVCGAAEKAHVAPTCGQRGKRRLETQKSPAAAGKILPFGRSQHRIWLVAGNRLPAKCLKSGRSPYPLQWKRRKDEKRQTIDVYKRQSPLRVRTMSSELPCLPSMRRRWRIKAAEVLS